MTLKWIALLKNHKNCPVAGSFNPKPPWVWQSRSEEFAMGEAVLEVKTRKKGHHQRSSKSLLGVRRKKGRVSFKKKRSAPQTGSILVWIIIILPPNSGEDLKKQKRSSPQTGYVLVRISGILPPNFGEHQKKNI